MTKADSWIEKTCINLDRLTAWSACWGLSLNPSKCKSFTMTLRRAPVQITYNIGGTVLEHVDQIRDLGIIIDSKLTLAQHVDHAVNGLTEPLGFSCAHSRRVCARPGTFRTSAVLTAYFANVRSILEYGSVIWAGAAETHTARIDRVQHKFLMLSRLNAILSGVCSGRLLWRLGLSLSVCESVPGDSRRLCPSGGADCKHSWSQTSVSVALQLKTQIYRYSERV